MEHRKIIILGAGPAGYTAALYAARAGLNPTLLAGSLPGGQLVYTHHIENFPGFGNISGIELVDAFRKQVEDLGVQIIYEAAQKVDILRNPFHITLSNGSLMLTDSLIIATGSSPKWLGVDGEQNFKGKGVSICATCDGFFYKGKTVAVIGGGNTALYEALFLATIAKKVILIHRENTFSGEQALQNQLKKYKNIQIMWNTEVISLYGKEMLSGIYVKNTQTAETANVVVDGVFEAIGQTPNSELFLGQLDVDEQGYIITNHDTRETSIKGVFAAGDCTGKPYQLAKAAGEGNIAALSACEYVDKNRGN